MKSISLASLSIVALSLALTASAALKDPISEQKVIDYINDNPDSLKPACFWSGRTRKDDNPSEYYKAYDVVQEFKKSPRDCVTLGDIVLQAGVHETDITSAEWPALSKAFAQSVAGHVYVLLGEEVRDDSVWLTIEQPELLQNTMVSEIDSWGILGDGTTSPIN
ncbi:hypothetical protein DXG01_003323 [Tephrocybe rancida]|nr:hypothetical protein DXG01_003323 [Tephrocybe rancida]